MKARILVSENDRSTRNDIVRSLEGADHQCLQAANRADVQAVFQSREELDLTLVGINLVKEDGVLLAEVKERYPGMPVVVITAMNDISVALSAIRNGAYDYLLKPFDREQLLATVRRALENRRLKLENRAYQTNLEALVSSRTAKLREAVSRIEKSDDITVEVLGDALGLTDAETYYHSKRVTAYTIAIARAMGLNADQIRVIARGAFLHDIGKMAIPDAILLKPGPLDPEEIATMREHSFRGYQILRRIPFLAEAAEIVYCHHENYDGTGYPRHLKRDEIPLGARIVAVANTLDAITTTRPYRTACPLGAASAEIHRWSGRQFDPDVVRKFLIMPEHIWNDLRRGIDA